jgi:hypothetical protein
MGDAMSGYRFNFGSFDGQNVSDVPTRYLEWVVANFTNKKKQYDRFWKWVAEEEIKKRRGNNGSLTKNDS